MRAPQHVQLYIRPDIGKLSHGRFQIALRDHAPRADEIEEHFD